MLKQIHETLAANGVYNLGPADLYRGRRHDGYLFADSGPAKEKRLRPTCVSNLKQVALGLSDVVE
jgi:hypothetical protein